MLSNWLVYILLGRLLIWGWQQFPLPKSLEENRWARKLHDCDFCSGVWIFTFLSFVMQLDLFALLGFYYVPALSEGITGIITSFMTHIFVIGWKARFDEVTII